MKRLLCSFIFLLIFSLVLIGCGANNEPASAPNNTQSPQPGEEGKESGETVKLTMGSWRTEDREGYEKIFAEFNKLHPNIEIEFSPTKNTEYNTVLNTALQTGGGPDIIHLRPYAPGIELGEAGYLEAINDLNGLDVFSPEVMSAATAADGTVYGVPMAVNSAQILYNKKIFEQYNLEEPQTWDQLIALAETLKENNVTPIAIGSKDGWILSLTHAVLGPGFYGGGAFVEDVLKGEKDFTSPEFIESIQVLKDLTPYFPDNFVGLSYEDMRALFATEQAAMYILGDWAIGEIKGLNPDLELDLFPVPVGKGSGQTVTSWVDGSFAVNANSPHKEEALKFLEFATTQEFGTLLSNELSKASTIPGVSSDDPIVTKVAEYANSIPTPYMILVHFNQGNPPTKVALENALQGLFLDELTAEEVAQEVQKSADSWFVPAN